MLFFTSNMANPFGKLKHVIVGTMQGAAVPFPHYPTIPSIPNEYRDFFLKNAGKRFPEPYVSQAENELEGLVKLLESKDVVVDRPEMIDYAEPIRKNGWEVPSGLFGAMPRDILLGAGKKIIVAPMCWRTRHREIDSFLPLLKKYEKIYDFEIIIPPRPKLTDESFVAEGEIDDDPSVFKPVLTEAEPLFDAADFFTLEDVVIGQQSLVTNKAGVSLVKKLIAPEYQFCEMKFNDPRAMHIDATFLPVAEGLILTNAEYVDLDASKNMLPRKYHSWDIVHAPNPIIHPTDPPKYFTSDWLSINILTLDSRTVIVEEQQESLIKFLESWGLKVLTLPFNNFQCFGGSFHCATHEVLRDNI
jgi:glycine amidinotransferase